MSAPLTEYHRINVILPTREKKLVVKWAKENGYTMTSILRQALKDFFKKKGVELI